MPTMFVAVGQDGLRMVSEDGSDWKNPQVGKEGETYRCAAFGNERYVAAGSFGGDNIFATTTDGVRWDTVKTEAKYVQYVRGLAFDGRQFVAIGGDPGSVGASKPFLATSEDGLKWSALRELGGKHIVRRLAFGKGLAVGVGDRGRRVVSA